MCCTKMFCVSHSALTHEQWTLCKTDNLERKYCIIISFVEAIQCWRGFHTITALIWAFLNQKFQSEPRVWQIYKMDKHDQHAVLMHLPAATHDCGFELFQHPLFSPDLLPLRLSPFPKHETGKAGTCFASLGGGCLCSYENDFYDTGITFDRSVSNWKELDNSRTTKLDLPMLGSEFNNDWTMHICSVSSTLAVHSDSNLLHLVIMSMQLLLSVNITPSYYISNISYEQRRAS